MYTRILVIPALGEAEASSLRRERRRAGFLRTKEKMGQAGRWLADGKVGKDEGNMAAWLRALVVAWLGRHSANPIRRCDLRGPALGRAQKAASPQQNMGIMRRHSAFAIEALPPNRSAPSPTISTRWARDAELANRGVAMGTESLVRFVMPPAMVLRIVGNTCSHPMWVQRDDSGLSRL